MRVPGPAASSSPTSSANRTVGSPIAGKRGRHEGRPGPRAPALWLHHDEIRLTINAYTNNGLSIEEIERFWLDLLDLPQDSVRTHTLNHMPTSSSGRAKTRLRYGVCFLTVDRTWVVQHIYGAIQEYGGFDEPRWLD